LSTTVLTLLNGIADDVRLLNNVVIANISVDEPVAYRAAP
jgi:hypothetical protein